MRLSGQTIPGATIRLSTKVIPTISRSGKFGTILTQKVWPQSSTQADERGSFEINMDLPFTTVQLPFEVSIPSGQLKNYQISLLVEKNNVKLDGQENVKNSPYARRKWGVWGGLGYNYLKYEQNIPEIPAGVGFQSFAGPALYAKVVRSLNSDWAFQSTINRSPGKAASSSSVTITKGSYEWSFLTGEFTYMPPHWKMPTKKMYNQFGLQAGLQYHVVPLFARSSATDPAVTSVETNSLLMMAAGGTWIAHYGQYWLFEAFMRYQYPLQSGSRFDIDPQFAFDGSLGIIHKLQPDWRVGFFWYGQWHKYNFKNAPDKFLESSGGGKVSGDQSLFFSDLEFRVGYEFD